MSTNKTQHYTSILSSVNELIGQMVTIQDFTHKKVMLEAARYVFIYKDATIVEKVLNNITGVKGSFRVESLAYWFQHIAGISVEYNEKKGWHSAHLAKDEYPSNHGIPFTYDKDHLDHCRNPKNRFWEIAPIQIKELKAPDLEKVTTSAEIQLARGLAIGVLSEQEVLEHLEGMLKRVKDAVNSKAVKKWTGEYFSQHGSTDSVESEIAELLKEEELSN
jgi:hypothetical protein